MGAHANSSHCTTVIRLEAQSHRRCVTGAVLTHDVMYKGFYFLIPPMSALCTLPQRGEISNVRKINQSRVGVNWVKVKWGFTKQ